MDSYLYKMKDFSQPKILIVNRTKANETTNPQEMDDRESWHRILFQAFLSPT